MHSMRFRWTFALVSALAMTAVLALPAPASAFHTGSVQAVSVTVTDNTLVLNADHYQGYTFSLGAGDSIVYAIQVTTPSAGATLDVYFFKATGLAAYRADPPQTSQAVTSLENHRQFGGTFSAATGAVTVIIDNVNTTTGARATGTVTVQVGMSRNGGGPPSPDVFSGIIAAGILLCVGVIAVIVIVIFLIVYLITRSNRPAMPPGMPAYMPPQQPWPPPQPPQPPPQGGMPPGQYPPQNP
jgi:hypothetical protein